MFVTSYLQNAPLQRASKLLSGGICKFWFVPIHHLQNFPAINPLTQNLESEPTLLSGKSWLGAIALPDNQRGYEEKPAVSSAGVFYKRKLTCIIPGFSATIHHLANNMVHQQFCIVAMLKAAPIFIVLGNKEAGLSFTAEFDTGSKSSEAVLTKIVFDDECMHKALLLSQFSLVTTPVYPNNGLITEDGFFITTETGDTILV